VSRHGFVIRLRPGKVEEYKRLHAAVWPEVLATIDACGIRDYSIFWRRLDDGRDYLFATYEYVGSDLAADLARMASDPATQRWWSHTAPLQEPLEPRAEGSWWAEMEEVFRRDGPAITR
jgi:L-rhamnose mutarotase